MSQPHRHDLEGARLQPCHKPAITDTALAAEVSLAVYGYPYPSNKPRNLLRHHPNQQQANTLPGHSHRWPPDRNPPALPPRRPLQTPRLRRHARPHPSPPPPTDITLERSIQLIKGGFSHRLASKPPVWQRGFTDRRMRDREDFLTYRTYIHDNPVRAHLCQRPENYPYSSAYRPYLQSPQK
jgi:hypothetical protein